MRTLRLVVLLTLPVSLVPLPRLVGASKRAITFDDFINLPVVSDPQLSPDGQVGGLHRHHGVPEGQSRHRAHLARGGGDGEDAAAHAGARVRPVAALVARWPDAGVHLLAAGRTADLGARHRGRGGEARQVTSIDDGVGEIYWKPDGQGLARRRGPQVARRPGDRPAQRRLPDRRAAVDRAALAALGRLARGQRQHVFAVDLATGEGHGPHAGGSRRPHHRHERRRGRRRVARRPRDRRGDARGRRRRHEYQRGHLSRWGPTAAAMHDVTAASLGRRQHATLFPGREVALVPVHGARRLRGGPAAR